MLKNLAAAAVAVAAATLAANNAHAAGFALQEQADGLAGAAYVGIGAAAQDASTAFYNPAGMTALSRSELELGARYIGITAAFHNDGPLPQTGGTGGDAGMKLGAGSLYYVYPFSEALRAGISLNSPFGVGVEYPQNWAGRYFNTKDHLTTYEVNPSLAYKVADWLSIGGGIDFVYATLGYNVALNNVLDGMADGSTNLDLNDFAIGYNLGALIEPRPGTRIGLTYRSRLQFDFSGSATMSNVGPTLHALGFAGDRATLQQTLPDSASLSLYQQLTSRAAVLGDLGWEHWSLLKDSTVYFSGGGVDSINRDWHDTFRVGLGFQYALADDLRVRVGASYDSSPTSANTRQPDLPIDRQIRAGIGGEYDVTPDLAVGASYEYVDLGRNSIDVEQTPLTGTLVGHYDEYAQVVGVNARFKF
jgi:long-chain fatty acid transport protein